MATLGSLVVHVGADIASFTSDMNRAAALSKKSAGEMGETMGRAAAIIGAAALAAGAAVVKMVSHSVDAADNMRDMKEKGRSATREKKKHCVNGHAFTPENTFKKENGTQGCKQCNRNRALKWKYEHLAQVREFQKIRARVKRKAERMKNANSL